MAAEHQNPLSTEDYRSIIALSVDGFTLVTVSGDIIDVNDSYCQMVGYTREELLKMHVSDVDATDSVEDVARRTKEIILNDSLRFVTKQRHKNGSVIDAEITANYTALHGGLIFSSVRDVTQQKLVEKTLRQNEERYKNIVESQTEFVDRFLPGGILTYVNDALARFTGVEAAELLGKSFYPFLHDDDRDEFVGQIELISPENTTLDFECRILLQNESMCWTHWTNKGIFNEHGVLIEYQSVGQDVTKRRVAEEALRESEQKHRLLFDSAGDSISVMTLQGKLLTVNPTACQMLGYTYDELIALSADKIDAKPELLLDNISKLLTNRFYTGETELVRKDGSIVSVSVDARAIDWDGQPAILSICRDITENKKSEKALRNSESKFSAVFNASPDSININRLEDARFVDVNNGFTKLLGYSADEVIGKSSTEMGIWVNPEDRAHLAFVLKEHGSLSNLEANLRHKDGSTLTALVSSRLIELNGELCTLNIARNISKIKQIEVQLKASEERFRSIMSLSPDIISIIGTDGSLIYNSSAAFQIHGYTDDEMHGKNTIELIHPDDQEQVGAAFNLLINDPSQTRVVQYRYKNKDGSYVWMECTASNLLDNPLINGIVAISRCIEERKKIEGEKLELERQLLHTQKLESLGIMAGGIAHDFNNLLQSMLGNLELATYKLDEQSDAKKYISYATNSAKRAAHLTDLMLTYAGKRYVTRKILNLNHLIKENMDILRSAASSSVAIDLSLFSDLPAISAGEAQIQQVIMNLITNAAESITSSQGHINITTSIINCDEEYLATGLVDEKLKPGHYVCLEVTDNGCGMNKDTLSRIFDPFFTTKFTGRGLGMAAVLGILKSHCGTLFVDSKLGKGTTFRVLFPVSETTSPALAKKPITSPTELTITENAVLSGVLLLVDDDKSVLKTCGKMAELIGFKVIKAHNGMEALAKYREHQDEVDVVILDVSMPDMNGFTAMNELYSIKPDIKVILASGYNEDELSERIISKPPTGFIRKPYSLGSLEAELRKVLVTGQHS